MQHFGCLLEPLVRQLPRLSAAGSSHHQRVGTHIDVAFTVKHHPANPLDRIEAVAAEQADIVGALLLAGLLQVGFLVGHGVCEWIDKPAGRERARGDPFAAAAGHLLKGRQRGEWLSRCAGKGPEQRRHRLGPIADHHCRRPLAKRQPARLLGGNGPQARLGLRRHLKRSHRGRGLEGRGAAGGEPAVDIL